MLNISENIVLAPFTTFKIGGQAKFFIKTASLDDLFEAILWAKNKGEKIFVLGGGSNLLISDSGFDGLVIQIPFNGWRGAENSGFEISDSVIYADAGVALSKILSAAVQAGLSGFEWAVGIPGTIGGAARGNSGAFGKGTGDFIETVEVFNAQTMKKKEYKKEDCLFGYRESVFKKNKNLIILKTIFKLEPKEKEKIQSLVKENLLSRAKNNSAYLGKSAGCFFKNIPWDKEGVNKEKLLADFPELALQAEKPKLATGFLIDFLGLKGKEIGGASVPYEHANYIINKNNASAQDVLDLANLIKGKVFSRYGIILEEEAELVGF